MRTALQRGYGRLAVVGCALVFIAGCSASEQDTQGSDSTTTGSVSPSPGYTKQGQDMCALLTDKQVATYLGDHVPQPERSSKRDRPTCTWDAESIDQVEVALWVPPIRSIITEDAKRTIGIGDYTGYVETETKTSCTINIEGPDRFLNVDVSGSEKRSEDGKLCNSVSDMAHGVLNDLDW